MLEVSIRVKLRQKLNLPWFVVGLIVSIMPLGLKVRGV